MKTIALVNPAAGGVAADGLDRIRAALQTAGVSNAEVVELDTDNCETQLSELARQDPDMFVVWGGDGTLRTAMSTLGERTRNLLLLPGGTMNMLTKAIHGDLPWDEILSRVIAEPRRRTIPAGAANGHTFYCAMIAGAPVRLAEAREAVRRGELVKAASEAKSALESLESLHLDAKFRNGYDLGGKLPQTSMIAALVGPLSRGGGMEIAALSDLSATGAMALVWSSLVSDWRTAENVQIVPAQSLEISSEDGEDIPVLIDGESLEAGSRVRVKYIPEAAQCLTAQ